MVKVARRIWGREGKPGRMRTRAEEVEGTSSEEWESVEAAAMNWGNP